MSNVCQDYGHGGGDPGAVAIVREKDGNLRYGQATTAVLIRNGFAVRETRVADVAVSLSARVQISDNFGADWFISHHENAGGGHGIEVYCYKFGGRGEKLAREVLKELVAATGMPSRGVKEGNFQVLRETDAPAILIEFGFVDNASDAAVINRADMPGIYADAVVRALCTVEGRQFVPAHVDTPAPAPVVTPPPVETPVPTPPVVTPVLPAEESKPIPLPEPPAPVQAPTEPNKWEHLKDVKLWFAILGMVKIVTDVLGFKVIEDSKMNDYANALASLAAGAGVISTYKK
jgi:N-acetylmuramoyl-L-alanine amidase